MDGELVALGERIRSRMPDGLSQRGLAERTGMKPDALSRALNGQRGFSSRELARIADEIGADLYWLVTGERDPRQVSVAARHVWDVDRGVRMNPGRSRDEALLQRVVETYNAAFPDGPPPSRPIPDTPEAMRDVLGEGFVRQFSAAVETRLGVDVIRLPMLSTDYSLTIGARAIVMLTTTPNWFRSNWSLSHELAHLALGHHGGGTRPNESDEAPADDFAARLLLPEELVARQNWHAMNAGGVARFLWETGVSTAAMKHRLATMRIHPPSEVVAALKQATPITIRVHTADEPESFEVRRAVVLRQQESSTRAVPPILVDALQQRVEDGAISPEHLAWILDVSVDEIDFPEPNDDEDLARAHEQGFGDRPSRSELTAWLAARGRPAQ